MFTYAITIGRNYGKTARTELQGTPMSDQMWAEFEDKVNELLAVEVTTEVDSLEVHRGTGVWEGVSEESTVTTLRTHYRLGVNAEDRIRRYLRNFADFYGQDAIALSIGQSELIENSFVNQI